MDLTKIKNFVRLYGDNDDLVVDAALEKRDYIRRVFYVPCDLSLIDTLNINNLNAELIIENWSKLFFVPISLDNLSGDLRLLHENELRHYRKATLFEKVNRFSNNPFWLEYDCRNLSVEHYRGLGLNLFKAFSKEEFDILPEMDDPYVDALKHALLGNEDECHLIIDEDELDDDKLIFPYLASIHILEKQPDLIVKKLVAAVNAINKAYNLSLKVVFY